MDMLVIQKRSMLGRCMLIYLALSVIFSILFGLSAGPGGAMSIKILFAACSVVSFVACVGCGVGYAWFSRTKVLKVIDDV
jgi:hypothetical protein